MYSRFLLCFSCSFIALPACVTPTQTPNEWQTVSIAETTNYSKVSVQGGFPTDRSQWGKGIFSVDGITTDYKFGFCTTGQHCEVLQRVLTLKKFFARIGDGDVTFFITKGTLKLEFAQKAHSQESKIAADTLSAGLPEL